MNYNKSSYAGNMEYLLDFYFFYFFMSVLYNAVQMDQ